MIHHCAGGIRASGAHCEVNTVDGIIILAVIFFVLKSIFRNKKIEWKTLASSMDDSGMLRRVLNAAEAADEKEAPAPVTKIKPVQQPSAAAAAATQTSEPMHGQEMLRAPLRTAEYQPMEARLGYLSTQSGSLGAYSAEGSASQEGNQSMEGLARAEMAQWESERYQNDGHHSESQEEHAPFTLRLDGDALLHAVVMNEILQRPHR